MTHYLDASAVISPDGRFRYRLWRHWGPSEVVTWIMLNPSTADALVDDPTIRACCAYASSWGFGGIEVVNLFALRTPHPKVLRAATGDRVGPENDHTIRCAVRRAHTVIAAWGNDGALDGRDAVVRELVVREGGSLHVLGLTKWGHPKHPLARGQHRVPRDARPVPWTGLAPAQVGR